LGAPNCRTVLDESESTPKGARSPCPNCGSIDRFVSAEVVAKPAEAQAEGGLHRVHASDTIDIQPVEAAKVESVGKVYPARLIQEQIAVLLPIRYRVEWLEPTNPDGSYTVSIYDDNDNLIDMAESTNPEDAILAVAERLLPSQEDG
jgi:hypothetical protein